jgi:hypothetical protein
MSAADETVADLVIEDDVERLHAELRRAQENGAEAVRRYVAENARRFYASWALGMSGGRLDEFMRDRAHLTVDNVLTLLGGEPILTRDGRVTATRMKDGFVDNRPMVGKLKFLVERWKDVSWAVFAGEAGACSGTK